MAASPPSPPDEEQGYSLWLDAWRRLKKNRLAMFGLVVTILMSLSAASAAWISPFEPEVQQRWTGALPPWTEVLDLRNEMRFEPGVRPARLEVPEMVHAVLGDGHPHTLTLDVHKQVVSGVRVVADGKEIERLEISRPHGGVDRVDELALAENERLRHKVGRHWIEARSLAVGGPLPDGVATQSGRYVVQLELIERDAEGGSFFEVLFERDGKVEQVRRNREVQSGAVVVYPHDVADVTLDEATIKHLHILGTDQEGRDHLSRLIYGGQISLLVGITATLVSLLVGVLYGAISGYVGGRVDGIMMRIVDVLFGLPYLILVILLLVAFGRSLMMLFIALGAVQWLMMARIVRGQVLSLREKEFVDAAVTVGSRPHQILARHLIPNTLGVVVVYTTLTVPAVILFESFLAFLGLTVEMDGRPLESWGALVNYGRNALGANGEFWWLLLIPATAMSLTLFSLNFLGDGLRDALDPQQRGRG